MKFRVVICLLVICFLCVDLSSSWRRRRRRRRQPPPPPPTTTTTTTTTTPTTTTTTTAEPTPKPVSPNGTVDVLLQKLVNKHGKKAVAKFLRHGFAVYNKYKKWYNLLGTSGAWLRCAAVGDSTNIQPKTAYDYETIVKAALSDNRYDDMLDSKELEIYDIPVVMEDEWDEYMKDAKQDVEDTDIMDSDHSDKDVEDQDTKNMEEEME